MCSTRTYATLTIYSDSDSDSPDAISARLGIGPDEIVRKGSVVANALIASNHAWSISTKGLILDGGPDAHLACLFGRIPVSSRVNDLVQRGCEAWVWLFFETSERNDGVMLSPEIVKKIADIGASIALDIYMCDEEAHESGALPE